MALKSSAKASAAKASSPFSPSYGGKEPSESKASQGPLALKLHRPMLLYVALCVPLLWSLLGFLFKQGQVSPLLAAIEAKLVRGNILDRSGAVLAEGDAEQRSYPQREIAANVIGFSGREQEDGSFGLEGLELTLDSQLQAGQNIKTTLDLNLQIITQESLRQSAEYYQAQSASAIVLATGTSEILAAASYPEFDPNHYGDYGPNYYANRPFMQAFDPGSVFKPMVVAAALEAELVGSSDIFTVPMQIIVGTKEFHDVLEHGPHLTTGELLKYSSNVGMIQLASYFDYDVLYHWLEDFGFNRAPPIRKLFVKEGSLRSWENWVPQDRAALSIGQGINTTLVQLALAYSIFANQGRYIPAKIILDEAPGFSYQVISPQVASDIMGMLVQTAEYGSARNSLVPGVKIAGKTGTADAFDSEKRQYLDGDYNTCFAGIFPADAPKAVAVVCLQKPKGERLYGSTVAAPVFRTIVSESMALWGMLPSP